MDSRFVSSPSAAAAAAAPVVNTTTAAIAAADITTLIGAAATTGFLTIGDPESRLAAREALKAQIRREILAEQAGLHPLPPHKPTQTETATGQWRCDLCEMSMASEVQFTEHLEGVKHRDLCEKSMAREAPFTEPVQFVEQQAKDEKGSGFVCDVCQMGMTSETAFQEHLKGKKHQNKAVAGLEPMSGRKRKAECGDEPAGAFNCDLCQVSVTGAQMLDVHLKGKKHRNKAEAGLEPMSGWKRKAECGDEPAGAFNCDLCHVSLTSAEMLDGHLKGKKHRNKAEAGLEPMSGRKRKAECGDEPAGAFNCDLCQVSVTSAQMLDVHLKGKKHRSKEAIGVVSTFECEICGVQCTAQSLLDAHLTGKKHKAMVEKSHKDRQEATASTTK